MSYLKLDYTNYKGERRLRDVAPISLTYQRNNPYHGDAWILEAYDIEKRRVRSFDIQCIHNPEVMEGITFIQHNWKYHNEV